MSHPESVIWGFVICHPNEPKASSVSRELVIPHSATTVLKYSKAPTCTQNGVLTVSTPYALTTGIDPVTQQVILRIDTFAVTIPAHKFNLLTNGTFNFDGTINKVTYKVTIAPLGSNSFKLSVKGTGQDLSTLGRNVPIVLMVGGNTGTNTASHKQ
jgi:hypothetical protein